MSEIAATVTSPAPTFTESKETSMVIFSLGLLAVAAVLLILAVVKSSVALGVAALCVTALAGITLISAYSLYRRRVPAGSRPAPGGAGQPYGYEPTRSMAPAAAAPTGWNGQMPVVPDYPDMNATQAAALADTLGLEEAYAMRRYELEHAGRKTVITAIDRRIESVLQVQKRVRLSGQSH